MIDEELVDAIEHVADALNRIASALEDGLTSEKAGKALDGLASLSYATFAYEPERDDK